MAKNTKIQLNCPKGFGAVVAAISDKISEISAAELFEHPALEPKRPYLQEQLESGCYLFAPELIHIKEDAARRVCGLLREVFTEGRGDKPEAWEKLSRSCQSEQLSAGALLDITLNNCWLDLQDLAEKLGLDINLLQLFSLYLARPFRQRAAELILAVADIKVWQEGYCPFCGHGPVLGRIADSHGQRKLWCCCCNTQWRYPRIGCHFCHNQSQHKLGYLTVEGFADYRIYVCDECKRYLKFIKLSQEQKDEDVDWDREYFSTAELDEAALNENYVTEPIWPVQVKSPVGINKENCTRIT